MSRILPLNWQLRKTYPVSPVSLDKSMVALRLAYWNVASEAVAFDQAR